MTATECSACFPTGCRDGVIELVSTRPPGATTDTVLKFACQCQCHMAGPKGYTVRPSTADGWDWDLLLDGQVVNRLNMGHGAASDLALALTEANRTRVYGELAEHYDRISADERGVMRS